MMAKTSAPLRAGMVDCLIVMVVVSSRYAYLARSRAKAVGSGAAATSTMSCRQDGARRARRVDLRIVDGVGVRGPGAAAIPPSVPIAALDLAPAALRVRDADADEGDMIAPGPAVT
jgi:hypothetical protein